MNIIVTGCSRGVGLEICKLLLEEGDTIYGIARSFTKELEHLKIKFPSHFHFKSLDLSNVNAIHKEVFKDFVPNKIAIDGLVNNAAIAYDDIITNLNYSKLQEMYSVNVFTPMVLVKYSIRNMIYNKVKGSIIHISSISAHTGYKG